MILANLLELDARLSDQLRLAERPGPLRSLAGLFAHSGDSWLWLLGLVVLLLVGAPPWRNRALILIGGIIVTALMVLALKFAVRRRRPEGDWGAIYRKSDPHSFPSGHAARAVMLAVVAMGLGPLWLGLLLMLWAPLVALARVVMGLHYLSDVVVGMVIGGFMGLLFLQLNPLGG